MRRFTQLPGVFLLVWALVGMGRIAVADRPNVILMMCDDLGWGDVGFNGNPVIRTPNLDEMAAGGLKFQRFYAASAVCSPTRGSVITGRHPQRLGIPSANAGHIRPEEYTLAELLKKQGYTTGHFGKWHLGTLTKTLVESNRGGPRGAAHYSPPWDNGFDICFSTEAKVPTYDPMLKPRHGAKNVGWDYLPDADEAVPYGTHYWDQSGRTVKENLRGDDSRRIMDRAVPFIQRAVKQGKPFFAVVWFHAPHLPVVAGPEHGAMYSQYESYAKNYYGCITAMDQQVGRLRRTLRDLQIAHNTMFWFCSDNGPEGKAGSAPGSAGPFRGRKRDLFEGGVRVPGLLEWPARVKPGRVTDFPAVTSDYTPTILDVLGIAMPDARPIDGISLVPLLDGTMSERPRPIGFAFRGKVALSANRYKIVRYPNPSRPGKGAKRSSDNQSPTNDFMLFDLLEDPSETTDLAAKYPQVVRKMSETLQTWLKSCEQSNAHAGG